MKLVAIACALGALFAACSDDAAAPDASAGIDGSTDGTDAADSSDETDTTPDAAPVGVAGRVTLPAGVTAATVINALGRAEVVAGVFELPSSAEGRQLAVALSSAGKPLVMGWLDADHDVLGTRTTAEVVAYLAIGGYHVPVELQPRVIAALAAAPELDAVASALDAALTAHPDGPFDSEDADPVLETALETAVYAILASDTTRSLLVNPTGARSGIRLDTVSGVNEVVITNTYRRRGFAFVDRVATYQGQVATPAPAEIARVDIDPVEGLRDVIGTIKQIIIGANEPRELSQSDELAYTPKSTAPIELRNVEGVSKTRYRIAIVGPGEGAGDSTSLSAAEDEEQRHTSMRFVVEDYVIPFVTGIIAPVGIATQSAAGKAATQGIIEVLTEYPEVVDNAVTGAVANVLAQVIGYGAFAAKLPTAVLTKVIKLVAEAMYGTGAATAAQAELVAAVKGVIQTMAVLNVTLKLTDSGIVDGQMALSNRADVWTVDVADVKIVLDPADSTLAPGEFVTLTAHVPDAGDDVDFEYRFETPGAFGTLQSALARGDTITSSDPYITYDAAEPGTETVTVTVFEIRGSDRVELGHADATVRVTGTGIVITPRGAKVPPYGTLVLGAGLPAAQPGQTRRLVWAVDGDGNGPTLDGEATVEVEVAADAEPPTVTFAAGFMPGEHTVTARLYAQGSNEPLAEGSTTVTVDTFRARITPAAANLEPGASRALDAAITPAPREATITYAWAVASDEGTIDGLTAVEHEKPAATDRVTYQAVADPQHCQQKVSLDVTIRSGGETVEVPRTHAFLRVGCPVTASIAATPPSFEVPMETEMVLDISLSEGAPPPEELRYVYSLRVGYPVGLPLDGLTTPDGTAVTGIPTESPRVIWTAPSIGGSVNLDVEVHHVVDGEDAIIATVWAVLHSYRPDIEEPGSVLRLELLDPGLGCGELDAYAFELTPNWVFVCDDQPERKFVHVVVEMPPYTTAGWCDPRDGTCYPPTEHPQVSLWGKGPPFKESEPFWAQSFAPPGPGTHWVYAFYLLSGCYAPEVVASYDDWLALASIRCIASDKLTRPE